MTVGLYSTKIVGEILAEREIMRTSYRVHPDETLHWLMADLGKSSDYRLSRGPEDGYIRGEEFFNLVSAARRPYGNVRLVKEIGDAALLCSSEFRPLFEIGVLMQLAARQLAYNSGERTFPFEIRIGFDFGIAKKLSGRDHDDYLGESIDRLSRIMSLKPPQGTLLIGERAYDHNSKILAEYASFFSISQPKELQLPDDKKVSEMIVYREIALDQGVANDFGDYFSEWNSVMTSGKRRS